MVMTIVEMALTNPQNIVKAMEEPALEISSRAITATAYPGYTSVTETTIV